MNNKKSSGQFDTNTDPKIEILHERDPDGACTVRVWIDGVEESDFRYDDMDPGRGYGASEWDESREDALADPHLSEEYREALDEAYRQGHESKYVEED